ncbi:DUF1800 family protein [Pedobacter sp. Leaf194]|uniref:DUF1800 domain-containing protein n=1 Tax=Pedobacter sp. Leaf194 TaxID=1736297 RepID=UPI0007027592|nr:DUF1800 domain-containing protein [Pedobacter sp. Leaf194]KQS35396.1 hypothetical protein ASG14_14540 [Pedobacter sp. Leaf194]
MAIDVYSGNFGTKELNHLLKRTLFGAKRSDISSLAGQSLSQVVDLLLKDLPLPNPPVNNYNDAGYTDANVPAGQTWVNAIYTDGTANSRRVASFKAWWLTQMLNQPVSLREKMTLFWHNHFSTEADIVDDARYIYKHNNLLRSMAFGNFKSLVKQVTIDPAMLRYLNGYASTKTAPDENYSRELQELFTVGKGPDSKYTEADVKAAARLLTGYTLDGVNITSVFNTSRHDTTDKQFSSFYGNKLIKGRTGTDGAKEVDDLLDMIFTQVEVSKYVCRRLYRFFVYYDISADIEANIITPLAEIFRTANYEIKPVLKALLTSSHFYLPQNRSCNIKAPVDFVVGLAREFEIVFPDASDYVNVYYMSDYLRSTASNLQQNLGDPPNVSGWPAYYQVPQFYELWINSDTLPKRNIFTDRFISTGYTRNGKKIVIDPIAYTAKFSKPEDPNVVVDEAIAHLYTIDVSADVKKFLKSILLSNQVNDAYWTTAWTDYKAAPTTAKTTIVQTRLQEFYKYIMNLEEYQLS